MYLDRESLSDWSVYVIGINVDNLDDLIKKNNFNLESLSSNLKSFKLCLNELDNCYDGNSIHSVFFELLGQGDNLKKIEDVLQNYSEVLKAVKVNYQHQDEELQYLFNHINIE